MLLLNIFLGRDILRNSQYRSKLLVLGCSLHETGDEMAFRRLEVRKCRYLDEISTVYKADFITPSFSQSYSLQYNFPVLLM